MYIYSPRPWRTISIRFYDAHHRSTACYEMIPFQHHRALRRGPRLNQGLIWNSDLSSCAMHDSFHAFLTYVLCIPPYPFLISPASVCSSFCHCTCRLLLPSFIIPRICLSLVGFDLCGPHRPLSLSPAFKRLSVRTFPLPSLP